MIRLAGILIFGLATVVACGDEQPREADEPTTIEPGSGLGFNADTQFMVDSAGNRFEIVIQRPQRVRVSEVHPREGAGDPDDASVLAEVEPRQAYELMRITRPPWYVIDVRTVDAYVRDGFLADAKLVDASLLVRNIEDLHVRTDQTILVYGGADPRAMESARTLASYGFPAVRVLRGGLPAWKEAGLPVEHRP